MALAANLPRILTDPSQFESSMLNLVANSRDAMPGGGVIKIAAAVETTLPRQLAGLAAGSYVCVRVEDTGEDRKSTRLNSSHPVISYAGVCLKKKARRFPRVPD